MVIQVVLISLYHLNVISLDRLNVISLDRLNVISTHCLKQKVQSHYINQFLLQIGMLISCVEGLLNVNTCDDFKQRLHIPKDNMIHFR